MTTTDTPPEIEDATWHRLDPRMLLIHPVVEVGRALPALLGIFLAGSARGDHYWGLVAAGVVAALSLVRWFTTRLRVAPDSVQLVHGLLRRRTITAARDRIRTVDVTAHPLHRALGLARVVIGTGTNDRKGDGRLVLDGLARSAATRLRDDLLHRITPVPAQQPDTPVVEARELARLDRSWIRFAPFTLSGVATGLVIWGFYWRVQDESGVDLARSGPLHSMVHALRALPTPVAAAVVVASVVLFVAITSTAGYVLSYWGFRLVRHSGGTLQITRGLLTARATSIERRRLVGVAITEPLPLRVVGATRTLAIATGLRTGRGAERGGGVLLPPAPRAASVDVGTAVLDGSSALIAPLTSHGPAARRRRLLRAVVAGLAVCAGSSALWLIGAPAWLLVLGVVALAAAVPLARDRYRSLGHAVVDGRLVSGHGSVVRCRSALESSAVIGWNLRTSWFQRRAGLTSLTATTAAGRQHYSVLDVPNDEALAIADAITPGLLEPWQGTRGDYPGSEG